MAATPIYMKKEADGSISFSDTPSEGAKKIEVDKPNLIEDKVESKKTASETEEVMLPPTEVPQPGAAGKKSLSSPVAVPEKEIYQSVEITTPKDQQTIWNLATLSVSVSVTYGQNKKGLQEGDKLVLWLDGRKAGEGKTTSFTLSRDQIPRGEHQLKASVVSQDNRELISSKPITIFIHYKSVALLERK